MIAEIVVTANRREERLRYVPVTVMVVDGAQLTRHNITWIETLARSASGLNKAGHRVVLRDELHDRHYLIVYAIDVRTHCVELGKGEAHDRVPCDAILRIVPCAGGVRQSGRTIAEVAAARANSVIRPSRPPPG